MADEVHYVFRDNMTFAIRQGKVIASHSDPDEVERLVSDLDNSDSEEIVATSKVVTPNGLQGTVLGKTANIWGDEVTIRLENGRIVRVPTSVELRQIREASTPKKASPVEILEERIARTTDGSRNALIARAKELDSIRRTASKLVSEVPYKESLRLDQIVVTAEVEGHEIADALAHLDDVAAIAPPKQMMHAAASTSRVSREDASWLDDVYDNMVKEASSTDFNKLLNEGPEAFVAELPDVAISDTGTTRQMASNFIAEKTAGVARQIADPYMDQFLSRVEACRRSELSSRKTATVQKEAAVEKQYGDVPDDALFL